MKRLRELIKTLPCKLSEVHLGFGGIFNTVWKRDESGQAEKTERENLAIVMKTLRKDIVSNPEAYVHSVPPFRLQYWAINNLNPIAIPNQIKPENWSHWLTKEEKERLQLIYELLTEHEKFVKQAKSENPDLGGKLPKEIYNVYMAKLLELTAKYEEE